MTEFIPFNRPYLVGKETENILEAHKNRKLSGDGPFTALCSDWLKKKTGASSVLLTHSATAALEMAALLLRIEPGDEVILPSFTFVSTANAFVLRGATPVFCDVREDTLNIDETKIEELITPRTRAIIPVHYGGVACEMNAILSIAGKHGLAVVEDAAQGVMSTYHGKPLGAIGDFGCFSFHETKNVISGEGGALIIRDEKNSERAEIIREKGTNRSRFFRGQVDKYTWVDIGSSYLPGEVIAAFLAAQLDEAEWITARRIELWNTYYAGLESLSKSGSIILPTIPEGCVHNAHMFYIKLPSLEIRTAFIERMKALGIGCVFHYQPLHSSPYGHSVGRTPQPMPVTDHAGDCLVRLPLWVGLAPHMDRVLNATHNCLRDLT